MEWQTLGTAPKGEKKSYGFGPEILGLCVGPDGSWKAYNIVKWEYHKNPEKGSWKGPHGVWTPDFWMPLPEPPVTA